MVSEGLASSQDAPRARTTSKRVQQLTAEVRNPSAHLTIVETPSAVTFTDDRGQSRTFHPDGKEEVLQLDGVPVGVTAKREAGRLVILYKAEQGRELRYTYSHAASPPQLVVDVQFVERGGGDGVRRIYQPASASDTLAEVAAAPSRAAMAPGVGVPAANPADSRQGAVPQTFNQQPDAELKGLTKLGVVVEDSSPQAAACGLNQGTLETAVSKRLTDAGFKVLRNSDEDTYVYVNVITSSLSNGLCVSRYDAFLHAHDGQAVVSGDAGACAGVLAAQGRHRGRCPSRSCRRGSSECAGVCRSVCDPDPRRKQVAGQETETMSRSVGYHA